MPLATYTAYVPTNTSQAASFYGTVTTANANQITLSGNGAAQNYYGSFAYRGDLPQGMLYGMDYVVQGQKQWSISSINLDASTMANYILSGDAAGAVRYALSGNDTINGSSGNDVLYGGAGNDVINGGGGLDTVVYLGKQSNFTISKTSSGYTVKDNTGAEGMDTLTGIARLQFADGTRALDTTGTAGQAYRIYQAAFNRTPDSGGLGYWISQMDKGTNVKDVAAKFIDSAEFKSLYGSHPTTGQLVDAIYSNVLHRTPDQSGHDYYVSQIDSGQKTLPQVLADFSESPENQLQVVGVIQQGISFTPFAG